MRAGPILVGLLLMVAAGQAVAQPPAIVLPDAPFTDHSAAHLPLADNGTFQDVIPEGGSRALVRGQWAAQSQPISMGPFSMDIGSSDIGRDGKRAHFAHLHIDDFHPLGGNLSGTFDGRAATLHLSWPTGQ